MLISTRRLSCAVRANCTEPWPRCRMRFGIDAVGLQLIDHHLRAQIGQQDVGLLAAGGIGKAVDMRDVAGMRLHPLGGLADHRLRRIIDRGRPFLEEHDELLRRRIGGAGAAGQSHTTAGAGGRGGAWPIPFSRETAIVLPGG